MAEVRQGTNEDNDCALAPADHLQMPLGHVHCAHELATELVIELCSHRQCLVWNQVSLVGMLFNVCIIQLARRQAELVRVIQLHRTR